jgi:hypothetical protein
MCAYPFYQKEYQSKILTTKFKSFTQRAQSLRQINHFFGGFVKPFVFFVVKNKLNDY